MNVLAVNRERSSVKFKVIEFDASSKTGAKNKSPASCSTEKDRWASRRSKTRRCGGLVIVAELFMKTVGWSASRPPGARGSS